MFEDSLLESGGRLAGRNPWTTAFSFAIQIFGGGVLVLMSLVYTETLPTHRLIVIEAPSPPPPAAAAPEQRAVTQTARSTSEVNGTVLIPPSRIPSHITQVQDDVPPGNPLINTGVGGPGTPDGVANSPLSDLLRSLPIKVPTTSVNKVRVSSGIAQGLLIRQVKPQYPPLARQARVQGTLILQAVIGKDGTVQDLRVVSGHPLLTGAAVAAAKQWLYRPYYLNGEPVEVDTQINVIFTLTGD